MEDIEKRKRHVRELDEARQREADKIRVLFMVAFNTFL
jgi:hypothetical protein